MHAWHGTPYLLTRNQCVNGDKGLIDMIWTWFWCFSRLSAILTLIKNIYLVMGLLLTRSWNEFGILNLFRYSSQTMLNSRIFPYPLSSILPGRPKVTVSHWCVAFPMLGLYRISRPCCISRIEWHCTHTKQYIVEYIWMKKNPTKLRIHTPKAAQEWKKND